MKTYLVEITQTDIDRGQRYASQHCPIARAIRRTTGIRFVQVATIAVTFRSPDGPSIVLPPRAQKFRGAFDHGDPVRPLKFKIRVPD